MRIGTDKKALQYLFENDSVDLIVAEFERLQGVINSLGDSKQSISDDYAALAAENERLRTAGDAMRDCVDSDTFPNIIAAWNAAKEGGAK